jgi:phosphonate transport system substrate-binding protein
MLMLLPTFDSIAQRLRLLPVIFACAFLCACGDGEEVVRVDLEKREEISLRDDAASITYAYLPQYSHRVSYERHHLLVKHLAEATGRNIRQIFPDTFTEHMIMIAEGRADISFVNPFTYIKIAELYNARAFARVVEREGRGFRGQIICRSDDARIKDIGDVKGKRWVAVDPSSAGGYLFALGHFFDNGVQKSDFSEIAFAPGPGGKQEKVVLSVYNGRYDVGSIREGTLEVTADTVELEKIRVLAVTQTYPGWVFAARDGLAEDTLRAVSEAMFSLREHPEHSRILSEADIDGIISAEDKDFDAVRQLSDKLGMDLSR